MRVAVVGLGYVGLVTAACLAEWGHQVVGVEADPCRIAGLLDGHLPFHEPGLDTLVARGLASRQLDVRGSGEGGDAIVAAELVILAVGTHDGNGGWQTETMRRALEAVVPPLAAGTGLVIRSTLPPEFILQLPSIVAGLRGSGVEPDIAIVLNPEFTQEGRALSDFMRPNRVVCGVIHDPDGVGTEGLRELYAPTRAPFLEMRGIDAAFAKLGANLFLAAKISFANELATLCDAYGAAVDDVVGAMALDPRIGASFLGPGVGFGGSCLPHQVTMTVKTSHLAGAPVPLLSAVDEINRAQPAHLVRRLEEMLPQGLQGRRVCLLGLTFKPETDDVRDAPSLAVARLLLEQGASVIAYDPMETARQRSAELVPGLQVAKSAFDALAEADAAALITEWAELASLDWPSVAAVMRGRVVVDGRNALDAAAVTAAGFAYAGFGRGVRQPPATRRILRNVDVGATTEEVVA